MEFGGKLCAESKKIFQPVDFPAVVTRHETYSVTHPVKTVLPMCPPGGVGFDINCGVRLLRTNLDEGDVQPVKEQLAQSLFDHIPVGVGSKGVIPMGAK